MYIDVLDGFLLVIIGIRVDGVGFGVFIEGGGGDGNFIVFKGIRFGRGISKVVNVVRFVEFVLLFVVCNFIFGMLNRLLINFRVLLGKIE